MATQEVTTGTTRMNTQELIQESQKWLDIISATELSPEQRAKIEKDTVDNFSFYYNRGYLEYRKSVIEMRDNPALEWVGQGSTFQDLSGRTYIDCLGGYGIYSAGIRHPKIVRAVRDQLDRMPLSSQELLDPLRGALAQLLGEITPGELQYSFFINNGTDAVEGAIKLARLYTGRTNFISSLRGFHGKSCGSLSLLGKWEYREPFLPLLRTRWSRSSTKPTRRARASRESSWSPCRARRARSCRRTISGPAYGRPATSTARS